MKSYFSIKPGVTFLLGSSQILVYHKDDANTYVVRKMRKTQYKLQKLFLVATYKDKEPQEWHMFMLDELREVLSKDYKFYLDLPEKGQKEPTAKQLRMMAAMKRIMGE